MAEPAVVNASPLIYLAQTGRIELLRLVSDEIVVPDAVAQEVRRWGNDDPAAHALATTAWLKTVAVSAAPPSVQAWDLGPGESAVLSHAIAHPGATAILDDLAARRCAVAHHVPCRGTLGVVLIAKQRGKISAARPLVEALRLAGMYLSNDVMNRALAKVGE